MSTLQAHRDRYAHHLVGSAGSADPRLIAAFASTPREDYLGPAPWSIFGAGGIPSAWVDDPALLYQDVLVGLDLGRGINNGQPTLHASCLVACAPAPGETVLHIGAGTGYYTAVLAALVGARGQVLAYEIEPELARRAQACLRHLPQVRLRCASGTEGGLPAADLIYVSAGASHPLASWLDALKPGGRLIFPLTPDEGYGGMLLVTRRGPAAFDASFLNRVSFIPCTGARDAAASTALAEAFGSRPIHAVRSLRLDRHPDASAWVVGDGWWLSTAASPGRTLP